jgi:hypothetical protein
MPPQKGRKQPAEIISKDGSANTNRSLCCNYRGTEEDKENTYSNHEILLGNYRGMEEGKENKHSNGGSRDMCYKEGVSFEQSVHRNLSSKPRNPLLGKEILMHPPNLRCSIRVPQDKEFFMGVQAKKVPKKSQVQYVEEVSRKKGPMQHEEEQECEEEGAADELEACILCGCILTQDMYKRFKSLDALSSTIRKGCVRTPYVYEYVVNMAASQNSSCYEDKDGQRMVPFCIACINWIRRLEASVRKGSGECSSAASLVAATASLALAGAEASEGDGTSDAGGAVFVGICCDDEDQEDGELNFSDFLDEEEEADEEEEEKNEREGEELNFSDFLDEEEEEEGQNEREGEDLNLSDFLDEEEEDMEEGSERDENAGPTSVCAAIEINEEEAQTIPDLQRMDTLVLIPLDNLILFLSDPGGTTGGAVQPDRRSLFRLMCALCATKQQTSKRRGRRPTHSHVVQNPYRMFCTPVTERILHMFERDYEHKFKGVGGGGGGQQQLRERTNKRGRQRKNWQQKQQQQQVLCAEGFSSEVRESLVSFILNHSLTNVMLQESNMLVSDIVRCWWETVGMPAVLPHRGGAKLVRKALRLEG